MFKNRRKIAKANKAYLIAKLSGYFEVVDYGKLEIPSFLKAENIVDTWLKNGFLTPMYELKTERRI